MAEEVSAAQKLLQKHAGHSATVEDAPEEDVSSVQQATLGSDENVPPSWDAAPAASKQQAKGSAGIDTQSHELFPELGGPKPKPSTAAPPIWSAKTVANGKTNGATSADDSTPMPPPAATASTTQRRTPAVSIPGRNVETLFLEPQHIMPRTQLKRPIPDIIKDVNRKSRANITLVPSGNNRMKLEAVGAPDVAQQALRDLVQQIGTKLSINVPIPASSRAHIIGKQGSTIKSLQEKTGARIQLPKVEDTPAAEDDDEEVDVIVEGNALSAATARDAILKIVGERSANSSTRVKGIPVEFYPFIAGPKNSLANSFEQNHGVQVRVPAFTAWSDQPVPQAPAPGQPPVFHPAANDGPHIQLAGDRVAFAAVKAEIDRQVQDLHKQLVLEQLNIQRGRHQFIIGERGIPMEEFFDETGCAILLPTDQEDDVVTIIGSSDRVQVGLERAMDLAMNMQCSNIDISRFHRQAPGGAAAHARNVTRYLRQRKEIERLEKQYGTHINTPFTSEGALPWELFARDGKNAIRAQSEIKGLVDSHPPARFGTVPVDPFFHSYLRSQVSPEVRQEYGVNLVVPEPSDSSAPVLLVFESPSSAEDYLVPNTAPTPAEIRTFAQGLRDAQKHISDLIGRQDAIKAVTIDVPHRFHERLRRFIKKEQEGRPADQIPIRVSSLGTTVTFRGPSSAVQKLAEKAKVFLEQEKEEDKERGFTLSFDFEQKFANHLIGKGGSNIKDLRDRFDVEIQVGNGQVELKGPKAKAEAAKTHILAVGRQLADEVTYTIRVDPKFHRELIGSQGSQIHRLQNRYKVLINFPRSSKGKDEEETVEQNSESGEPSKPKKRQAPDEVVIRGPKRGADESREELLSLVQYLTDNSFTSTITVQQKQVPSLIGTGGMALDELRSSTGAKIDVPNNRENDDAQVEIQIKGTKTQVANARKILEQKKAVFDDTVVKTIEVDRKYHRSLIGGGGATLRDIVIKAGGSDDRRELSRTVQFPKHETDGNTIKVEGRTTVVDNIISQIQKIVAERESQITDSIDVPVENHRSLIGRGGDVRRNIESQFNVTINVPRQGSGQTRVDIAGQAPDVEQAKKHIEGLVEAQKGETVQVPRAVHHSVANNGQFFKRLRNDHSVTVDHAGQETPPKPVASTRPEGGALPLITDDADASAEAHSWNVVESVSSEEGEIPWVLRGTPDNVEKAKKALATAIEQAKKSNATGYLALADPRNYRYVVGQGGSKVNSIRKQTGCRINVPDRSKEADAIEIVGSKEGVEKARDLILEAVQEGISHA